jgi:hypothetical protein
MIRNSLKPWPNLPWILAIYPVTSNAFRGQELYSCEEGCGGDIGLIGILIACAVAISGFYLFINNPIFRRTAIYIISSLAMVGIFPVYLFRDDIGKWAIVSCVPLMYVMWLLHRAIFGGLLDDPKEKVVHSKNSVNEDTTSRFVYGDARQPKIFVSENKNNQAFVAEPPSHQPADIGVTPSVKLPTQQKYNSQDRPNDEKISHYEKKLKSAPAEHQDVDQARTTESEIKKVISIIIQYETNGRYQRDDTLWRVCMDDARGNKNSADLHYRSARGKFLLKNNIALIGELIPKDELSRRINKVFCKDFAQARDLAKQS